VRRALLNGKNQIEKILSIKKNQSTRLVRRILFIQTKRVPLFSGTLFVVGLELQDYDVSSLQTLGAFLDGEFHLLAFLQVLEAFAFNGREVNENIGAAFAFDESETFCAIEPFNRTDYTIRHFCLLSKIKK
jgi:hypothetical protein